VIGRPDGIAEFLALYWQDDSNAPIANQVKRGLATAFNQFNRYQFAKWRCEGKSVTVRDALRMVRPSPKDGEQESIFNDLYHGRLTSPDTWEVALSSGADKKATFTRLIQEGKLGALAFLRNLRNMERAGVDPHVIINGFERVNPRWLLPLNFLAAAKAAPRYEPQIEALMLKTMTFAQKWHGHTVLVVDVSGSMNMPISGKSDFTRMDVAGAMAILAREICSSISIYATAGSDYARTHSTMILPARRGFALSDAIRESRKEVGGGGIFTRQCLDWIRDREQIPADRILVFSDSEDCDVRGSGLPSPFGKNNYIIDVSSGQHGINYQGVWTAEISGWSEHFIPYVSAMEGYGQAEADEEDF